MAPDRVIELGAEFEPRDVLQVDLGPVRVRADDDLAEFTFVQQASLRPDGVGVLGARRRRLATELARRRERVLL